MAGSGKTRNEEMRNEEMEKRGQFSKKCITFGDEMAWQSK